MIPQLRDYQVDIIKKIVEAKNQGSKSILAVSATGTGKCLGKGTPVLMFDGSVKKVEKIIPGELITGPDSLPRTVESICSGREEMFKITPIKGDSFTCNKSHILSLRLTPSKGKLSKAGDGKKYSDNEIVNISVEDYLKSSNYFKHRAKLWRTGIDFPKSWIHNLIDPYFLGIWLGDGTSRIPSITTMDSEIIDYIYGYAKKHGLNIRKERAGGKSNVYHLTSSFKGRGSNHISVALREMNLTMNKHIPECYKINSEDVRLQVLAGLIDTDGSYSTGCYDYITKLKRLSDDILFLCRSLGFSAYESEKIINGRVYYRISISGDIERIPCKIKRKQAKKRIQKKNHLVTGFSIESIGIGNYYGFEISGPDRLFLLGDFTVTHNTVMFSYLAHTAERKDKRVLIVTHRREILKGTVQTLFKFEIQSGVIQSGKPYTIDNIQVAMVGTLVHRLEQIVKPDLIIVDEAHHSVAGQWMKIQKFFPDVLRVGFSATPERADGEGLIGSFETMIEGPSIKWQVDNAWLARPRYFIGPDVEEKSTFHTKMGDYDKKEQFEQKRQKKYVGNVINHYREHLNGLPVVCFCVSIEHCHFMEKEFQDAGYEARTVKGNMDDSLRDSYINGLATGEVQVVCSCDVISEGVDVPVLAGVILLRRTKSLALFLQQIGRALRPVWTEGMPLDTIEQRRASMAASIKPYAIILDHAGAFYEHGHPLTDRDWSLFSKKRSQRGKITPPDMTVCPSCGGCFNGKKSICPDCGYNIEEYQLKKAGKKTPTEIDGILREVMEDGTTEEEISALTEQARRIQEMSPADRQKALLANLYRNGKDSGKVKALVKIAGYKENRAHTIHAKKFGYNH